MARQKGLTDFKLALIRYLMRLQGKKTPALAEEIEYSVSNLSKVLNRQSTGMRISAKCVYRTFCDWRSHREKDKGNWTLVV